MIYKKRQTKEAQWKNNSKDEDLPVHNNKTLRSDEKRKREELKNSTIGGF